MKLFGEFLIEKKAITEAQFLEAVLKQVEMLPTIPSILNRRQLISTKEIMMAFKHQSLYRMDFRRACIAVGAWSNPIEMEVELELSKARTPLAEVLVQLGHLELEGLTDLLKEYLNECEADRVAAKVVPPVPEDVLVAFESVINERFRLEVVSQLNQKNIKDLEQNLKVMQGSFRLLRFEQAEAVVTQLLTTIAKWKESPIDNKDWETFGALVAAAVSLDHSSEIEVALELRKSAEDLHGHLNSVEARAS